MPAEMMKTALVMVDVQDAFLDDKHWGTARGNPRFEHNAVALLDAYRQLVSFAPTSHKLIHVNHASLNPAAPLHPSAPGFAFQSFAKPLSEELSHHEERQLCVHRNQPRIILRAHFGAEGGELYIAGLTTDHCVSTTTRMARNLKVVGEEGEVVFIEDATATFKKHEASPYDAEIVHGVHMESLREFASIRKTQSVIDQWRLWSEER